MEAEEQEIVKIDGTLSEQSVTSFKIEPNSADNSLKVRRFLEDLKKAPSSMHAALALLQCAIYKFLILNQEKYSEAYLKQGRIALDYLIRKGYVCKATLSVNDKIIEGYCLSNKGYSTFFKKGTKKVYTDNRMKPDYAYPIRPVDLDCNFVQQANLIARLPLVTDDNCTMEMDKNSRFCLAYYYREKRKEKCLIVPFLVNSDCKDDFKKIKNLIKNRGKKVDHVIIATVHGSDVDIIRKHIDFPELEYVYYYACDREKEIWHNSKGCSVKGLPEESKKGTVTFLKTVLSQSGFEKSEGEKLLLSKERARKEKRRIYRKKHRGRDHKN